MISSAFTQAWYKALASPRGVKFTTPDPARAKQKLYEARKAAGDEALMGLSIVQSPFDENEIWILKRGEANVI